MPRVPARRAKAKTYADAIVKASQDLYEALVGFAKMKGWIELGYRSFGEWADENMPVTRWVAYQELNRANVLDKIATALALPIGEVSHAAAALPQGEASAVARALDDDSEIIDAIVVETSDPLAVMEKVRAVVAKPTDRRKQLIRWAQQVRKMEYPDALDKELYESLVEAQIFLMDCLASWEEK